MKWEQKKKKPIPIWWKYAVDVADFVSLQRGDKEEKKNSKIQLDDKKAKAKHIWKFLHNWNSRKREDFMEFVKVLKSINNIKHIRLMILRFSRTTRNRQKKWISHTNRNHRWFTVLVWRQNEKAREKSRIVRKSYWICCKYCCSLLGAAHTDIESSVIVR